MSRAARMKCSFLATCESERCSFIEDSIMSALSRTLISQTPAVAASTVQQGVEFGLLGLNSLMLLMFAQHNMRRRF